MCSTLSLAIESLRLGQPEIANEGRSALDALKSGEYAVALIDASIPGVSAIDILRRANALKLRTRFILLMGRGTVEMFRDAYEAGAREFLEKPVVAAKLVSKVRSVSQSGTGAANVWADRLERYLGDHAQQRRLRLSHVCEHFGISRGYATRLFRECHGTTFSHGLALYRIAQAKFLLDTSELSISEISEDCGFTSPAHLSRTFRQIEGRTAREYRRISGR